MGLTQRGPAPAETLDRADSALEASSGPSRGPGTLSFSVSARSALELEESCGTEAVAAELASLTRQVGRPGRVGRQQPGIAAWGVHPGGMNAAFEQVLFFLVFLPFFHLRENP